MDNGTRKNDTPFKRGFINELTPDVFRLAWPATLESILQFTVGMVAMGMIGHLGSVSIGAAGLGQRVLQILWALAQTVTVGCTVLVAQAVGAAERGNAWRISLAAVVFSVCASILIAGGIALSAARLMSDVFNAEGQLAVKGAAYLRAVSPSIPFTMFITVAGACLRGAGDSRTPMVIALLVNAVNVLGHATLVPGCMGLPPLGLYGSSASIVLAQAVGSVLMFTVFMRFRSKSKPFTQVPLVAHMRQILSLGWPAGMESLFWQVATVILTSLIVTFGTATLAAHQLGLQAEGLCYMPNVGFSLAVTALVGQSMGSGNYAKAKAYTAETAKWGVALTLVTGSILMAASGSLMSLLTSDAEVVKLGSIYLLMMGTIQIPQELAAILNGAMRGAGETRAPMLIAAAGIWAVRLPLAFLLGSRFHMGIIGVWIAILIDVLFKFASSAFVYLRASRLPSTFRPVSRRDPLKQ